MKKLFRFWRNQQAAIKKDLKKRTYFRVLGRKIFSQGLWKVDKRSISGGLSLGLFIAFMPTIGFQMMLVVFGAVFFKVNLPIALVACWVTNPVTAIPIYTAAWKFGKYISEDITPIKEIFDLYGFDSKAFKIILHGLYLWTGTLIFSIVSALTVNIVIRVMWYLLEKTHPFDHLKKLK